MGGNTADEYRDCQHEASEFHGYFSSGLGRPTRGRRSFLLPILPRLKDSTSLKLACRQIGIGSNLAGSQFGRVGFLEHESTRLPTPNEGSRIAGVSLCGT